jgi:hypothetical protein
MGNGTANIAAEAFTVADPRPPTAVLNVTVPDWVGLALPLGRAWGFGANGFAFGFGLPAD